jgi:DNA replication protein DnaC
MKNALLGYTFQNAVALLLLAKMDVEREMEKITLETVVNHQFDDIRVDMGMDEYFFQIKDFKKVQLKSLSITGNQININGTPHQLSTETNVIFFKEIDYVANTVILGIPAYDLDGIYIVSLNRTEIEKYITKLYRKDPHRRAIIEQYFAVQMDKRELEFAKFRLPLISVYSTKLQERTVRISRKLLEFKDILLIEGKPGIGKSHLVGALQEQFAKNVLYRFWISNQDQTYEERLQYANFLTDLGKKIFNDFRDRTEAEILASIKSRGATLILDGLDHVENYNRKDLQNFVDFIERAQIHCKVIVLSRPLQKQLPWKKQILTNWNERQTRKILAELYHIDNYPTAGAIYEITSGYPILVSYIAQQYKKDGGLSDTTKFESIEAYYNNLLKDERGKQALAIFLCSRGFIMRTELKLFLSDYPLSFVSQFIEERPFLFELRLNRISLFHDSLITYLRKSGVDYSSLQDNFNTVVFESLMTGQKRFQSRIGHFELARTQNVSVLKWYSSIDNFKTIMRGVIDFEAIREFYHQLRNMLCTLDPEDLEVNEYYDLTLIINLTQRDHASTITEFQFTYVKALIFNGYTEEDITSSKYLFAMWYYLKSNDASLLLNASSDDLYDTQNFHLRLDQELDEEINFFDSQAFPFKPKSIEQALHDVTNFSYSENIETILVNLYVHEKNRSQFQALYMAIKDYMDGAEPAAIRKLINAVPKNMDYHQAWYPLGKAKKKLISLGVNPETNDYINLTLKDYLIKHGQKGSFTLTPEVFSYLRLSLHRRKPTDIESISVFWTKYYQRKDYTLFGLDMVLTVFELKKWIHWQESIRLISEIQEITEKGYGDLLARYTMQHDPAFLLEILSAFERNELTISWFDLRPEYLDLLPEELCRAELIERLQYNFGESLSINKFENLLTSNKVSMLEGYLKAYHCQLRVSPGDRNISLLDTLGIKYIIHKQAHDEFIRSGEEEINDPGKVDSTDSDLIKLKNLTPAQLAATPDGDNTALADPGLFRQFSKASVKRDFKAILFNALTGKSNNSDYYHVLWVMPGTILKLMHDQDIEISETFLHSFQIYLDLSLISFPANSTTDATNR